MTRQNFGMLVALAMCACGSLVAQTTPVGSIPSGFTRIFNGRDLSGWHISRSNHHGTVANFHVENSTIVAAQQPLGQGGIVLTNRKYRDFELVLEANPDHDTDGGIFLRSTETGAGYQVDLTPRGENAPVMTLVGEDLHLGPHTDLAERRPTQGVWKLHDWNGVRIRIVGEAPRVTLWLNEILIWDVQQARNDLPADATEGMIALQCHWNAWGALDPPTKPGNYVSMLWRPAAVHRYRNIAVKELK